MVMTNHPCQFVSITGNKYNNATIYRLVTVHPYEEGGEEYAMCYIKICNYKTI